MFNPNSLNSILSYAKKLKGHTLREKCIDKIENHKFKGKGSFGQLVEKFYFGYEPNTKSEADFAEVGLELKCSPLKTLKNGDIRSKERLVLNIIDYLEVYKEDFEKSTFWKKNAHLLLIFYLHDNKKNLLDYPIKLVGNWKYPNEDLEIIKKDWETINRKIKDGKAHEISEGDTFYLGACTKGSKSYKSLRNQPFSNVKAKQRAYSLKQGYINHIIANIAKDKKVLYGKILNRETKKNNSISLEKIVISKFIPFYGKTAREIEEHFNLKLNSSAKSYYADLTKAILGIELSKKIEEFEKADVQVKTIRLNENNLPKEHISFKNFKYEEIVKLDWQRSNLKHILEQKFFFVFFQFVKGTLCLSTVKFWNMPYSDILEVKVVWDKTVDTINSGRIVKNINDKGIRITYFPKKSENRICHVRPHAKNKEDTFPLPTKDKYSGLNEYTKHCFWLNNTYIRDNIYLSN